MSATTKIKVDGVEHEAPLGGRLIDFLFTLGKDVPHFCYHPGLTVVASCRQCQVESKGKSSKPGLVVACREKIVEGMDVLTESPSVAQARQGVMEFLLLNHPLDCPICDKAGECRLQDTAYQTGQAATRYLEPKRLLHKRVDLGDVILLDEERCILCTRCIRFYEDVDKTQQMLVKDRGDRSTVGTFQGRPLTGNYQGNLADICPVGALTLKSFRFDTRVWDLQKTDSVCGLCSKGCNILIESKRGKVARIRPRPNEQVNGWWMCDEGRLEFADLNWTENDGRIVTPFLAEDGVLAPAAPDEAFAKAAELLAGTGVVAILSPFATCEEGQEFKRTFAGAATVGFLDPGRKPGLADPLLHTDDPCPNRRGLTEIAELQPVTIEAMVAAVRHARAVFLSGERLLLTLPELAKAVLQRVPNLVLHTRRLENLTSAVVALPCQSRAEKHGTWVNAQGLRQEILPALTAPGRMPSDRETLKRLQADIARIKLRPKAGVP
jgi:NADH-quinone oxidoreductase subunit G